MFERLHNNATMATSDKWRCCIAVVVALVALSSAASPDDEPLMSEERVVFQTQFGDIHFGFWPEVPALFRQLSVAWPLTTWQLLTMMPDFP